MHIDRRNASAVNSGELCRPADYMTRVAAGLAQSRDPYELAVLRAVSSLYDDLRASLHPRVVVLDEGQASERRLQLHPISFGVPAETIVSAVPHKTKAFGQVVPGRRDTYFNLGNESRFFEDLQRSLFHLTYKKGGWDCLRHLEILAAGALPLFVNIAHCPNQTLALHPKALYRLILETPGLTLRAAREATGGGSATTMHFEALDLDAARLNKELYMVTASALLQYTRNVLSTAAVAGHVLDTMFARSKGLLFSARPRRVLYLSHQDHDMDKGDYLTDLLLHGLKRLLGDAAVLDFPRRDCLYKDAELLNATDYLRAKKKLYGNGFSWGLTLDAFEGSAARDAEAVAKGLAARSFDLVILGSGHRDGWAAKLHFWDLVCKHYNPLEVGWVDGADTHPSRKLLAKYSACAGHLFSREGFAGA